jgi:hypothetical protein
MTSMRSTLTVVAASLALAAISGGFFLSLEGAAAAPLPVPSFPDFTGTYYRGDGLGVNHTLQIDARGAFLFRWDGCLGNYAQSAGSATPVGSELVLITHWRGRQKAWEVTEGRYRPIRWGSRRYLVPDEGMMSFLNEVNLGSEPRRGAHGLHYLRQDDWDVPVSGLPDLPASYRRYLFDEPIEGTILQALAEPGTFEVTVSRPGLVPGMALVSEGDVEKPVLCELKVLSLAGETAVVKEEDSYRDFCKPRPGHKVSTSLASLSTDFFRNAGSRWLE